MSQLADENPYPRLSLILTRSQKVCQESGSIFTVLPAEWFQTTGSSTTLSPDLTAR